MRLFVKRKLVFALIFGLIIFMVPSYAKMMYLFGISEVQFKGKIIPTNEEFEALGKAYQQLKEGVRLSADLHGVVSRVLISQSLLVSKNIQLKDAILTLAKFHYMALSLDFDLKSINQKQDMVRPQNFHVTAAEADLARQKWSAFFDYINRYYINDLLPIDEKWGQLYKENAQKELVIRRAEILLDKYYRELKQNYTSIYSNPKFTSKLRGQVEEIQSQTFYQQVPDYLLRALYRMQNQLRQ